MGCGQEITPAANTMIQIHGLQASHPSMDPASERPKSSRDNLGMAPWPNLRLS